MLQKPTFLVAFPNTGTHSRLEFDFLTAEILIEVGLFANLSGTSKINPLSAKLNVQEAVFNGPEPLRQSVLLPAMVDGIELLTPMVTGGVVTL